MKRKIIKIDDELCNGCGACVPNCAEGALKIIDGKARLISDLFCDGLGACLGHCPLGAITVEEREAEPYDEKKVMAENIVKAGANTIREHLIHLKSHGENGYLALAIEYLKENNIPNPLEDASINESQPHNNGGGCPGSRMMQFKKDDNLTPVNADGEKQKSELSQWPVQLHLVSPTAPYFRNSDVVLASDCSAFAMGSFHGDLLRGKSLAIACPKLDSGLDEYEAKIKSMIDDAKINTLTVVRMEVPCCGGLTGLAKSALSKASRKIPIKEIVLSLQGEIISENWI